VCVEYQCAQSWFVKRLGYTCAGYEFTWVVITADCERGGRKVRNNSRIKALFGGEKIGLATIGVHYYTGKYDKRGIGRNKSVWKFAKSIVIQLW
jgi:hypothetical protein